MRASGLYIAALCVAAINAQQFEVTSIRPSPPERRVGPAMDLAPGGRFTAINASLRLLLKKAFAIRDFQIAGAPDWIDSARYDIAAKTEGDRSIGDDQLRPLLQALLASRFNFQGHMESKDLPVYILAISKNGPKLQDAKPDPGQAAGVRFGGAGRLVGVSASMKQLAEALSDIRLNGEAIVDRPVIDETGLAGLYNFTLTWAPIASDLPESSIFTAVQDQLGLRLESRKAPVAILSIDRVQKPSEN